jgi:hypothetical protein
MDPLAVDLVLLRSAAPDLPIVVGRVLAGRVVERHGRQGIVSLAGAYLTAELPDEAQPGDRLRLVVRETTAERVVLQLVDGPTPPPLAEPPRAPLRARLPGGGLVEAEGHGTGAGASAQELALRCELPRLGTVELWLALEPERVRAHVALAEGAPLAAARAGASELRGALVAAAGRLADVALVARADPLDVYA